MAKTSNFAFAIEVAARIVICIVSGLDALGMIEHLMSDLYPEFAGAMVANLGSALLTFGSMAWPSRLNATRWYLCGPYFALTILGIYLANCLECWTWLDKVNGLLGLNPFSA
ncbi:hypothetical protein [Cupriavidus sp. 2SB]|uniref:hypothetical protein n=1 Tax=unclassified Cupriavidus TaxID=2640874 RepID=UPI0010F99939|nr:hypothetical protein [Cupriavidus sp. 2SB]